MLPILQVGIEIVLRQTKQSVIFLSAKKLLVLYVIRLRF